MKIKAETGIDFKESTPLRGVYRVIYPLSERPLELTPPCGEYRDYQRSLYGNNRINPTVWGVSRAVLDLLYDGRINPTVWGISCAVPYEYYGIWNQPHYVGYIIVPSPLVLFAMESTPLCGVYFLWS